MQASIRSICFGCIALLTVACGSKGDDDDDDGTSGNAGTSGSGGSSAGSGGSSSGSGGSAAGSGGSSAGTAGMSGGSGGGGGAATVSKAYTFDADVETWAVVFSNGEVGMEANWIPKDDIMLTWAETGGDPDGALQVDIPYSAPSQWVSIGVNFATDDLTDKTITARFQLVDGLGEPVDLMTAPGGAKLYAKSGMNYVYAAGDYFGMITETGTWYTLTFNTSAPGYEDPNAPEPFDPADIREIGIQFDSSGTTTTAMPATFLIDNVQY